MTRIDSLLRTSVAFFAVIGGGTGCGAQGSVGTPCRTDDDCGAGLLCDRHGEEEGLCQPAHAHADDDSEHEHADAGTLSSNEHDRTERELDDAEEVPLVRLQASKDAVAGWNVRLELVHFALVPEHVSTTDRPGEGHAHRFVDGAERRRIYGEWFYLEPLSPGTHELRVELASNEHAVLTYQGDVIGDVISLEQPDEALPALPAEQVSYDGVNPDVQLQVSADPHGGFNLKADLQGFVLVPAASAESQSEPVPGEGFVLLVVDDVPFDRMYGQWHHLSGLTPGEHELRALLVTSDYRTYEVNGVPVEHDVSIVVPE